MSRSFNAVSGRLQTTAPATVAPLTLSTWATAGAGADSRRLVTLGIDGSANNQFSIELRAASVIRAEALSVGGANSQTTATMPRDDTWHHVAGVFASTTSRIAYLDGVAGTENTTLVAPSGATDLIIGEEAAAAGDQTWRGLMSHVAIWNVALTAAEMLMLGEGRLSPLRVRPQSLVFYTPFLGRDSTEIDTIGARTLSVTSATATANEPQLIQARNRRVFLPFSSSVINSQILEDFVLVNETVVSSALRGSTQLDTAIVTDASLSKKNTTIQISESISLIDDYLRRLLITIQTGDTILTIDDYIAVSTSLRIVTAVATSLLAILDDAQLMAQLDRFGSDIFVLDDLSLGYAYRSRETVDLLEYIDEVLRRAHLTRIAEDTTEMIDALVLFITTFVQFDGSLIRHGVDVPPIVYGAGHTGIQIGVTH